MTRELRRGLLGVFSFFAAQTLAFVLVPLAAAGAGVPGAGIGVLVAALAGVGLVTDALVAVLSDRIGRRAPMTLGALLGAIAGLVLCVATDFPLMLVGAIIFGLAWSLAVAPAQAFISEASAIGDAARVQGIHGAVQALGALAGAITIGPAIERLGLQYAALVLAALMIIALVAFTGVQETLRRSRFPTVADFASSYGAAVRLLVTRPQLQVSALIALTFTTVMLAANSFLPVYLVHVQGSSVGLAATFLVIRNVAMTLASPFFGYAVSRTSLTATILGANGLAVLALAAVAPIGAAEFLAVALALQGVGLGFAAASVNLLVMSATVTGDRALGLASNNLVARLGSLLTPILFGLAFQTLGPRAVFIVAGLLGVSYVGAMFARARLVADQERHLWMPREPIQSD